MRRRQWICNVVNVAFFLVGVLLVVAGLVLKLQVFPNIIKNTVIERKILGLNDDGTLNDFTKKWVNPSYVSTIQYWAFDYQNTIGILNRAVYPDMNEIGPYTYDEIITNANINFIDNQEKMQFSRTTKYVFNPKKSCTTCNPKKDNITIPDISFFIGMQQIDLLVEKYMGNKTVIGLCQLFFKEKCTKLAKLIQKEIGIFMSIFKTQPFITVTVDQLLFSGYVSPLVTNLADRIIEILNRLLGTKYPQIDASSHTVKLNDRLVAVPVLFILSDSFGANSSTPDHEMLALYRSASESRQDNKNDTADTLYTIETGKVNQSRIGYIVHFENMNNSSVASQGNKLPSQWWPGAEKSGCDSTALSLEGTNGDFFKPFIKKNDSLPIYIPDICRTVKLEFGTKVSVKGIPGYRFLPPAEAFNYSLPENCGFCNPKTLSRIVRSFVPRFTPSENDETTIDIEPNTGTVLSANKRLQINALLNQFPHIGAYSVIRPGAYPLVWMNESFSIDMRTQNDLHSSIFQPEQFLNIVCWSSIGVGGFLMTLSAVLCSIRMGCFRYREAKKNN
ncbi:CD36 family protein [Dictyocaulus viviparus]|uniref:CD36 family protein n=1 Tax=Dictyocaulus viviparus TaxID=29172 RepID=A0A0D8XWT4_DICVI|nr:CD36 family protein [Dictyocaulus viviparus]